MHSTQQQIHPEIDHYWLQHQIGHFKEQITVRVKTPKIQTEQQQLRKAQLLKQQRSVFNDIKSMDGESNQEQFQYRMLKKINTAAYFNGIRELYLKGSFLTHHENKKYFDNEGMGLKLQTTFTSNADLDFGMYYNTERQREFIHRRIYRLFLKIISDKKLQKEISELLDGSDTMIPADFSKFSFRKIDHSDPQNLHETYDTNLRRFGVFSISAHRNIPGSAGIFDLYRLYIRINGQKYDAEFIDISVSKRHGQSITKKVLPGKCVIYTQPIRDQIFDGLGQFQTQPMTEIKQQKVQMKIVLALIPSKIEISPLREYFYYLDGKFFHNHIALKNCMKKICDQLGIEIEKASKYCYSVNSSLDLINGFRQILDFASTIQNSGTDVMQEE